MLPGLGDSAVFSPMLSVFDDTTGVYELSSNGDPSAVTFITPYVVERGRHDRLERLRLLQPAMRQTANERAGKESIPTKTR
jgi:hypothetical protein